jgi:hypothetical protein
MSKETAVEWLVHELRTRYHSGALDSITISEFKMHAKAMEKEQIITAYQSDRTPCSDEDAEQYYNETYK